MLDMIPTIARWYYTVKRLKARVLIDLQHDATETSRFASYVGGRLSRNGTELALQIGTSRPNVN